MMKQIFFILFLALSLNIISIKAQTAAVDKTKAELIFLTKTISLASVKKDATTLNRLMDDNFILYSVSNKTFRKAELIKLWTKKDALAKSESSTPDDFEVSIFGKTAIVFSTITDSETNADGKTIIIKTQAFDVWQKTKKGWRWIASRETLVR